jgi:hypothetical protein
MKLTKGRDIYYEIGKARKLDGCKALVKQVRRTVTRLVRNAKGAYMAKLLNPSRVLWKNLRLVGVAEDKSDSGRIIIMPDE